MANYSTGIILEKRDETQEGTFPVKLRVTIDRKTRYYGLGYYMTKADFKRMMGDKPRHKLKEIRKELQSFENHAGDILEAIPEPTFDQFKRMFTQKGDGGNVEKYYRMYIDQLKGDNRYGTASNYECSLNSLDAIMGIKGVEFSDIAPAWLKEYADKLEAEGKTISTIGIYLRPLRHLFNKAIGDGIVSRKKYPFGLEMHGKFSIPTSENSKRPLKLTELEALVNYDGDQSKKKHRDFFVLSYYLMGLNFSDLLTLKWQQIDESVVSIVRAKTKRTSRKKQRTVKLHLTDDAHEIIERHGNQQSTYVFGIINEGDDGVTIRRKVQNFTRATNQALKAIAKQVNQGAGKTIINPGISTVYARHSAASHGLKGGASLALISKSLGHSNLQITSNYIDSLDDEEKNLAEVLRINKKRSVP
jgi:integrase/recombinase XerD